MSENVFQKRLLSSPGNSPRSRKRVALEEIKGVQLNVSLPSLNPHVCKMAESHDRFIPILHCQLRIPKRLRSTLP